LRVRGKQWYWVYKFDLKGHYDVNTAHVILGRNKKIQAIRSDPTKWSIMALPTQGVYTLRDRASDPFDKINTAAVRSTNPNLYNRTQITPGNIKHIDTLTKTSLTQLRPRTLEVTQQRQKALDETPLSDGAQSSSMATCRTHHKVNTHYSGVSADPTRGSAQEPTLFER
jgi:hypothetical protein